MEYEIEPKIYPQIDDSTDARRENVDHYLSKHRSATKKDVVDWLSKFYDISGGGLRAFVNRYLGADFGKSDEHECPKCDKVVYGREEIREKFGERRTGQTYRFQSWCRGCR